MDYYQVLGVSKNSSQDEIKKAFRQLSFKHHPDKGGDEEQFKKINEAYGVIGDEEKRKQYDIRGQNPFEKFGAGFNPFEDMFGNAFYQSRKRTVPDKIIEVMISISECFLGVDKTISYSRKTECNSCNGSGGSRQTCNNCGGQGYSMIRTGTGLFIQVIRQICPVCNGVGQMIVNKCHICNGEGSNNQMDSIKITIPQGVDEGTFLRVESRGDYQQGMYGNLILRMRILNDQNFEKSGKDLVYNAVFGYDDLKKDNIDIPHPTGVMNVKLPNSFDTSKPLRVKSKGFKSPDGPGDLYIQLVVKFDKNHL